MPVMRRSTPSAVTVKAATAAADSVPVPDGKALCHETNTSVPFAGAPSRCLTWGSSRVTVTV